MYYTGRGRGVLPDAARKHDLRGAAAGRGLGAGRGGHRVSG